MKLNNPFEIEVLQALLYHAARNEELNRTLINEIKQSLESGTKAQIREAIESLYNKTCTGEGQ